MDLKLKCPSCGTTTNNVCFHKDDVNEKGVFNLRCSACCQHPKSEFNPLSFGFRKGAHD